MSLLKNALVDRLGGRDDRFGWREGETALPMERVRSVLLLHTDAKLGDALFTSLIVDGLRQARPGLAVTMGTTAGFRRYWELHPGVADVAVFPDRDRGGLAARLRGVRQAAAPWRGRFDALVSFDAYANLDAFATIRALEPRFVVGFNKANYRLFDVSLDDGRHGLQRRHIGERVLWTLRALGVDLPLSALRFHLPYGDGEAAEADAVLAKAEGESPRLLLNTYGAAANRSLTPASTAAALRALAWPGPVFLSVPKGAEAGFAAVAPGCVVVPPLSGFPALFALVARMDAVVSPDTAVAHVAAALDRPQVCLFRDRAYNPVVWRPVGERVEAVVSATGEDVNDVDWAEFGAAARRAFAGTLAP